MGDEEARGPVLPAQAIDQPKHLRLDGDVEGGGGLVGDQETRARGHGEGDEHALALPARKLVRPGARDAVWIGQRDAGEPLAREGRVEPALAHQPPDPHGGVKRAERVLEHRPRDVASGASPDGPGRAQHLRAVQLDRTRNDRMRRRGEQPQCGEPQRGLARAALPHQRDDLAGRDIEIHVPQGGERSATTVKRHVERAHRKDGRGAWHRARGRAHDIRSASAS